MTDIFSFHQVLEIKQEEEALQLSDAADFGCSLVRNAKINLARPHKSVLDLKDAFSNIPAILVGAGPSLEKNGHLLASFREKSLIFSGGSALKKIVCEPHFGACIDKVKPVDVFAYPKVPLCFQARMHPGNFDLAKGEAFLAPDGHFPFLNYLSNDPDLFDSGWTVGNFMVSLAVYFGCNPIVCVGMDYCYEKGKKYAFDEALPVEALVKVKDRLGQEVFTQKDWLMAVRWMEDFAKQHPEKEFLNASEGGMGYWLPCKLETLPWKEIPNLQKKVDFAIASASMRVDSQIYKWEQSLLNAQKGIREEVIEEQLLAPLWRIWKPVFEEEILRHAHNIDFHKMIFFEQVIAEHLDALS